MEIILCMMLVLLSEGWESGFVRAETGSPYPEDELFGKSDLFEHGYTVTPIHTPPFAVVLLEGQLNTRDLNSGYVMGVKWYNQVVSSSKLCEKLKIQVYSMATVGKYTLVRQTEWVTPIDGYNMLFFDKGVAVEVDIDYTIAIMTPSHCTVPVLGGHCNTYSTFYTTAPLYEPSVGDDMSFNDSKCGRFSIQGIFTPSPYADECVLFLARKDSVHTLQSHDQMGLSNYPSNFDACWIIRADKPDRCIHLETELFDLEHNGDLCDSDYLRVTATSLISDNIKDTANEDGIYCDTIFTSKNISMPYAYLSFHTDGDIEERGFKFQFKSIPQNNGDSKQTNAMAIWQIVLLTIFIIIGIVFPVFAIWSKKTRGYVFIRPRINPYRHLSNVDSISTVSRPGLERRYDTDEAPPDYWSVCSDQLSVIGSTMVSLPLEYDRVMGKSDNNDSPRDNTENVHGQITIQDSTGQKESATNVPEAERVVENLSVPLSEVLNSSAELVKDSYKTPAFDLPTA